MSSFERIALIGPMTGYPDFNYPAFRAAKRELRRRGFTVYNPAENFNGDQTLPHDAYLRKTISDIATLDIGAGVLLPGWATSKGALTEVHVCQTLGIPLYDAVTGEPLAVDFDNSFRHIRLRRPLIALSGRKFSGKSTLAQALAERLQIRKYGFALPLKEGLALMGVEVDGPDKDVEVLQYIGTDYFRQRDPDWWVKTFDKRTADRAETGLVIDDVRFPNELAWARDNGFLTVRLGITRDEQLARAQNMGIVDLDASVFSHASETGLDNELGYDLIFNESTSVEARVHAIMKELEARGFDCSNQRRRSLPNLALGESATGGEAPASPEPTLLAAA